MKSRLLDFVVLVVMTACFVCLQNRQSSGKSTEKTPNIRQKCVSCLMVEYNLTSVA